MREHGVSLVTGAFKNPTRKTFYINSCRATDTERPYVMHHLAEMKEVARVYYGTCTSKRENNSTDRKTGGARHAGGVPGREGIIADEAPGDRLIYHCLASPVGNAHAPRWGQQLHARVTPGSNVSAPAIVQQATRGFYNGV